MLSITILIAKSVILSIAEIVLMLTKITAALESISKVATRNFSKTIWKAIQVTMTNTKRTKFIIFLQKLISVVKAPRMMTTTSNAIRIAIAESITIRAVLFRSQMIVTAMHEAMSNVIATVPLKLRTISFAKTTATPKAKDVSIMITIKIATTS